MPAIGTSPGPVPTVLHMAPHPDDELIGAPATLMALRDAGWRVVNQACGLGSDLSRREARAGELREACRRAGFELRLPPHEPPTPAPFALRPGDDHELRTATGGGELVGLVEAAIAAVCPTIVVSPDRSDRHPAHGRVAAAAQSALEGWEGDAGDPESGQAARGRPPRWWTYGIWAPLAAPTLATGFDARRLAEIGHALAAHGGELERADYRRLVHGRAEAAAVTAPQLLFGFGNPAVPSSPNLAGPPEFAELLGERIRVDGEWVDGPPRWLDPAAPMQCG